MLNHRIIPCLLLRNGGLVKTLRFENPKYVGDPINAIRIFNEKEVDELLVLDIIASKENREPNYALLAELAGECFMPLGYGGGIRSVEQARKIFAAGVEKVCLQTAALKDIGVLRRLSDQFGSQSIIVSVDVKRTRRGHAQIYEAATGKTLSQDWCDYLVKAVQSGAGEVLLNAVDRDGVMQGMDLDLIRQATKAVNVPVIAIGGAGSLSDIKAAVEAGASAVSAGALFVFHGPHRAVLITYPQYEELRSLLGSGG